MIPRLFSIGPLPINSFGLMVALALIAGTYRLARSFSALGINPALAEKFVFAAGFSGLLGARIWFLAENFAEIRNHFWDAAFSSAGFTFYGGFIIAFLVMFLLCKKEGISFIRYLDCVGPTMALGYAIGRIGCQLSGDGDYGMATSSIFGMAYPEGTVPTPPGILAFPTPLYESTLSILILWILTWAEESPVFHGPLRRFGLYLALISAERFVVEFLRINPRYTNAWGFSEAQVIALCFVGASLVLLFRPLRAAQ